MSWFEVLVLSVVQGLTEFLPVSSSAHLVFVPKIFGWNDQGLAFDTATHVGTLFAVVIYFRKEIFTLLKDWIGSLRYQKKVGESDLAWGLIIATIPVCVVGLLLHDHIETYARSAFTIAIGSIVFGIVLYIADRKVGIKTEKNMTLYLALIIGFAQVLALMPGVSRSGITLTAGLFLGFSRVSATRFSFLLSIPVIFLAGVYEASKLIKSDDFVEWDKIIGATFLSFIFGYLCIHFFLKLVSKWSLTPFVVYRVLLGILLLWFFW